MKRFLAGILSFGFLMICLSIYCQTVPQATRNIDRVRESLNTSLRELMKSLPTNERLMVYIVPFVDENYGVTRLSEKCTEWIYEGMSKNAPTTIEIGSLSDIKRIMEEYTNWLSPFYEDRFPTYAPTDSRSVILKGRALIRGKYSIIEDELRMTIEMVFTVPDLSKVVYSFTIPMDESIKELLWYRHWPESEPHYSVEVPSLVLYTNCVAQKKAKAGAFIQSSVTDTVGLRNGDGITFQFQPIADCYVYVIYKSSEGNWDVLFPHPLIKLGNFCRGGITYSIPDPDHMGERMFELVGKPGHEIIFVVAAYDPLEDIKGFLNQLNEADMNNKLRISQQLEERITTRSGGMRTDTQSREIQSADQEKPILKNYIIRTISEEQIKECYIHDKEKTRGVGGVLMNCDTTIQGQFNVMKKYIINHLP